MNGAYGGMVSVILDGDLERTKRVLERVQVFTLAESLGGVESLVNHPAIMTHASVPKEVREAGGVTDNLIRLSVGVEDLDDLIARSGSGAGVDEDGGGAPPPSSVPSWAWRPCR